MEQCYRLKLVFQSVLYAQYVLRAQYVLCVKIVLQVYVQYILCLVRSVGSFRIQLKTLNMRSGTDTRYSCRNEETRKTANIAERREKPHITMGLNRCLVQGALYRCVSITGRKVT